MRVKLPAPEDLLLALCIHGSKHLWERLAWICDIAGLIESQQDLNWRQLIARARATGSERMLFMGLRLAVDLIGAQLPTEVETEIKADPVVTSLSGDVVRYLFTPELTPSGIPVFLFQEPGGVCE